METFSRRWAVLWALAIGVLTLMPDPGWPGARLNFFSSLLPLTRNAWKDVAANLMLYAPLGLALASRGVSIRRTAATAAALSTTLELLQYVVPGRDPSARDILANTLGAAASAAWLSTRTGRPVLTLLRRLDALTNAAVRADGQAAAVLSLAASIAFAAIGVASLLLLPPAPPPGDRYFVRGPILDSHRGPLHIGVGDDNSYFHGLIDEVRIYRRALPASAVNADASRPVAAGGVDPSLIAAYGFDDNNGRIARDASGNRHDGTIRSALWTPGRFGGALSFDGIRSEVVVPDSPAWQLADGMTLEAWIYPIGRPARWSAVIDRETFSLYSSADVGPLVAAGGGMFGGSNVRVRLRDALPERTWSHVTTTYDGEMLRFYVNGALANSRRWWSAHRLASASIEGLPLPYNSAASGEALAGLLRRRDVRFDAKVVCGERHADAAPLFLVTAPGNRSVINVLAQGDDLLVRTATRAHRLRLTAPDARFSGALAQCAPGRTLDVSITGPLQHPSAVVGGTRFSSSVLGLGSAWAFVVHSELLWPSARTLCAALWLCVLCVPFGYWARGSALTVAGAAAIAATVVLAPASFGAGPVGAAQASGMIAGVLVGWFLRAARRRMASDSAERPAVTAA